MTSTDAEARVRMAVGDKLGDAATITHLKEQDGEIVLHVVAPLNPKKAEQSILEAIEEILSFLATEKLGIRCRVNDQWLPNK